MIKAASSDLQLYSNNTGPPESLNAASAPSKIFNKEMISFYS